MHIHILCNQKNASFQLFPEFCRAPPQNDCFSHLRTWTRLSKLRPPKRNIENFQLILLEGEVHLSFAGGARKSASVLEEHP